MNVPAWALHPELQAALPGIRAFLEGADGGDVYSPGDNPLVYRGGFFTCPVLSPEFCDILIKYGDMVGFKPNADEEAPYQIPELVLEDEQRQVLEAVATLAIWPLFHMMYGSAPNHFSSVQLARYAQGAETGWHHDTESEASCVISLAPGLHKGGGTALRTAGACAPAVILPPLPQGHALLFNGRTTLHRGLPTTEGERNLLVYWMMHKPLV